MNTLLLYFLMTVIVINFAPGPAMMFVLQQSQRNGVRTGMLAALGIEVSVFIYVILTAFGISAVFLQYPKVYLSLQVIGAVYLLYLAYKSWPRNNNSPEAPQVSGRGAFMRGVFINLTNPKIALFFLSLLPQFVPVGSEAEIFILFADDFTHQHSCEMLVVALSADSVARLLKNSRWFDYVPPIMFVAISIYSVVERLT